MKRLPIAPRPGWQRLADRLGFRNHTYVDGDYWCDDAYFQLSPEAIERDLRPAVNELWGMCLEIVDRASHDDEILRSLGIPELGWDALCRSWRDSAPSICTRFDFAYGGEGPPKLHECNADAPGALFESSVFQWVWLEEQVEHGRLPQGCDQFNRLHDALVEAFAALPADRMIHVAASSRNVEDQIWARYLRDCAHQARQHTDLLDIEAIGLDRNGSLTDLDDRPIDCLIKAYRWEHLLRERFGPSLALVTAPTMIEPLWKLVLSSKGLLVWLWRLFPGHPNLLACWFAGDRDAAPGDRYVVKPLFSIKGYNVSLRDPSLAGGGVSTSGPYGREGHVIQALHRVAQFRGPEGDRHASVLGWIVGGKAEGIGVMECDGPIIHDEASRFVPHVVM